MSVKNSRSFGLLLFSTLAIIFGQINFSAAAALKIMPLGDSITDGLTYPGGYRVKLFQNFGSDPNQVVFVGSQNNGHPALPTTPVNEGYHEGHNGFIIKNIPGSPGLYENIPSWLNNNVNPDIILLMIGINDVNFNFQVATAPSRLGDLISLIANTKPNAALIVGSITPIDDQKNVYRYDSNGNARVNAFNAEIPGLIQYHHDVLGHNVFFCDINSQLSFSDLSDGLHPNVSGYNKMGDAWYAAIQSIPEPGTLLLLITGGLSLGAYTLRRCRKL